MSERPDHGAPLFEAEGLTKVYTLPGGGVPALKGIDMRIDPGEFVAITGPSGSGKSTLLGLLGLLARPSGGMLRFRGEAVASLDPGRIAMLRNREIGFVFQSFQLLDGLSALENVELPLVYASVRPRERRARARQALSRVGLDGRAGHRPSRLSGGEQQRVAIARAVVNGPSVVLADEPTGALDSATGAEVIALLAELNRQGTCIVVITHNTEVAAAARRRLALVDGTLQAAGGSSSGG